MSTQTTNLNLIKPELTDPADITAFNSNWDTLDAQLTKKSGDTMTGSLQIQKDVPYLTLTPTEGIKTELFKNATSSADYGTVLKDTHSNKSISLTLDAQNDSLTLQHNGTNYKIYSEKDKPPANDISGTVAIENGGTGATTAEQARTNLGITPANIGALATSDLRFTDYTHVSQIGLTLGEETLEDIASALPDNSRLTISINNVNNQAIYPYLYGMLVVTKVDIYRVTFEFHSRGDTGVTSKTWIAYMGHLTGESEISPWYLVYGENNKPSPSDIGAATASSVQTLTNNVNTLTEDVNNVVATAGNCTCEVVTYTGTGETSKTITFATQKKPDFVYITSGVQNSRIFTYYGAPQSTRLVSHGVPLNYSSSSQDIANYCVVSTAIGTLTLNEAYANSVNVGYRCVFFFS